MSPNKHRAQLCRVLVLAAAALRTLSAQPEQPAAGCTTGPSLQESNSIFVTGRQYISDRGEVSCDGPITAWSFCHYVIGFRHLEMELWVGAWRLEEGVYDLVGLNVIVVEPPGFEGDELRCVDYRVPASEWIEVQQGDYIGFFMPDNGVFVASASTRSDPEHHQFQKIGYGYDESFNASNVQQATVSTGRAIVKAVIDPNAERPATTVQPFASPPPSPPPPQSPSLSPTPTQAVDPVLNGEPISGEDEENFIPEIAVAAAAFVIILALLVIITVLIILLKKRRAANVSLRALPLARAVDATNPTTGTSDNGSVLYEAIYSQAYLQARDLHLKNDNSYSMIANPAYLKGDTLTHESPGDTPTTSAASSLPVTNPTYVSSVTQQKNVRYPVVVLKPKRASTLPTTSPSSPPPPTTPAPQCPAPPPPPPPYSVSKSPGTRPPALSLTSPPGATRKNGGPPSAVLSPPPQSPPCSPYSNPYKSPRPTTSKSLHESAAVPSHYSRIPSRHSPLPPLPPPLQTHSVSSTMSRGSDQTSVETQSTSGTTSRSSSSSTDTSPDRDTQ